MTDFEESLVHVHLDIPEDMLHEIRRLYMRWVELMRIDFITIIPPDNTLLLVAVQEWIANKEFELIKQSEIRKAFENGGRTDYLYDCDGNEYYTTVDGIRHYTRVEG